MKTTIDVPEGEHSDDVRFTGAKTKSEGMVSATASFNERKRMAQLTKYAGTCTGLITVPELQTKRRKG